MNFNNDEIKELIKGERSAVETYRQVFEKYGDKADLDRLRHFSVDHKEAVRDLAAMAESSKIEVPESSGVWGTWAKVVTGSAKVLGKEATLKALKEGEEHGLKQYESAIEKDLPVEMRAKIAKNLIPNQKRHIAEIDRLMEQA